MQDYIQQAIRTESVLGNGDEDSSWIEYMRLLHAAMGMVTEAGEFMDALKKNTFYGTPLDSVNLKEELGDIMWYMAIAMDALGTDFETEMQRNINKLRTRYPDKFTSDDANNRDLFAERNTLEG